MARSSASTSTTATPSPCSERGRRCGAGELGELVFATWRFGGEANRGPSPHANLIETQCHGFDMLEHLCGPIVSVAAQMTAMTYGAFSTVAIALEFASGAVGTMLGSYDSSYAYPDTQRIELNGTAGRAVIHDTVRALTLQSVGDETERVWRPGYFDDEARSFERTADRHLDACARSPARGLTPADPRVGGSPCARARARGDPLARDRGPRADPARNPLAAHRARATHWLAPAPRPRRRAPRAAPPRRHLAPTAHRPQGRLPTEVVTAYCSSSGP